MKNNRKGFTLVELLAVIVILAILMVSAGAGVMATMNNSKVNTFKNEVLAAVNAAQNMYSEISMNMDNASNFLKSDESSEYQALCVTLNGLVNNGYLDKDINTYGGVILVEVPFDGGQTKYMAWMHNSQYGVNGIEKNKINGLKFKKENNTASNGATNATTGLVAGGTDAATNVNGGGVGVVTKLVGIFKLVSEARTGTTTSAMTKGKLTAPTNGKYDVTTTSGPQLHSLISPDGNRGGTGKTYKNIPCINASLN